LYILIKLAVFSVVDSTFDFGLSLLLWLPNIPFALARQLSVEDRLPAHWAVVMKFREPIDHAIFMKDVSA
jgi:hypothetical protein